MTDILLIDDIEKNTKDLSDSIHAICSGLTVETWSPNEEKKEQIRSLYESHSNKNKEESNADEDIWKRVFASQEVKMVVVDHDLSQFKDLRISESSVANACKQLGIPICTYHRKPQNQQNTQTLSQIIDQSRSFSIEINVDLNNIEVSAKEIINIYTGFKTIRKQFDSLDDKIIKEGPARILATILEKPDYEYFFSKYLESTSLTSDIIKHANSDEISKSEDDIPKYLKDRLPFILGCLLYNNILLFPGIILNKTASASYINVDEDDFSQNTVYFKDAVYKGPFSNNESYWWRYDLDKILFEADFEEGKSFLASKEVTVKSCSCSVDSDSDAGYYCIVTKKPISAKNSKGRFAWVPEGADLCRINKKIYNKISAIMGL